MLTANKVFQYFIIVCFVGVAFFADAQSNSDYRLGSGDKIRITVFGQQDLSIETLLNDKGTIDYPFLGQVQAAGRTPAEFQQLIHNGLKGDYLINPNVSVSIVEYRPFFIDGEVENPGAYPFQPALTINKAAALAGGYTERASLSKIFIIRSNDPEQKSVKIDGNALLQPQNLRTHSFVLFDERQVPNRHREQGGDDQQKHHGLRQLIPNPGIDPPFAHAKDKLLPGKGE